MRVWRERRTLTPVLWREAPSVAPRSGDAACGCHAFDWFIFGLLAYWNPVFAAAGCKRTIPHGDGVYQKYVAPAR